MVSLSNVVYVPDATHVPTAAGRRRAKQLAQLSTFMPRRLHQYWARLMGYVWVPCAGCGQMIGGHEWRTNTLAPVLRTDEPVCRHCVNERLSA